MDTQTRIFGGWLLSPDSRGQAIHGGFDTVVRGTRAMSVEHVDDPPVIPPHDAELAWRTLDPGAAEAWLSGATSDSDAWAVRAQLEQVGGGFVYEDPDIPGFWFATREAQASALCLDDGPHPHRAAAVERCGDSEADLSMLEDVAVAIWIRSGGREVGLSGLIEADREGRALATVPSPEALLTGGRNPAAAVRAAWPEYPLQSIEPEARAEALSLLSAAQDEKDTAQARILADRAIHLLSDALGVWAEGAGRFPEVDEPGWDRQRLWLCQDLGIEVLGGPLGAHRRPGERSHTVRLMDDDRVEIGTYDKLTETEARLLGVTLAILPPDSRHDAMAAMRFPLTCRSFRRPDGGEMSTLVSLKMVGRSALSVIADLEPGEGRACGVELISAGEVVPLVVLATRVLADRLDEFAEALLGVEDERGVRRLLADYTAFDVPDRLPEWLVGAA